MLYIGKASAGASGRLVLAKRSMSSVGMVPGDPVGAVGRQIPLAVGIARACSWRSAQLPTPTQKASKFVSG